MKVTSHGKTMVLRPAIRGAFDEEYANGKLSSLHGMQIESLRVHSPMLASRKLAPSVARLGRIPRSCEAGGKHPCGV